MYLLGQQVNIFAGKDFFFVRVGAAFQELDWAREAILADGRAVLGTVGAISGEVNKELFDDVHVVELARQSLRGFEVTQGEKACKPSVDIRRRRESTQTYRGMCEVAYIIIIYEWIMANCE